MCSAAVVTSGMASALEKHWNIGVCLKDDENLCSLTQSLLVRYFQHFKFIENFRKNNLVWNSLCGAIVAASLGSSCRFFVCLTWDKQCQLAKSWDLEFQTKCNSFPQHWNWSCQWTEWICACVPIRMCFLSTPHYWVISGKCCVGDHLEYF